MGGRESFGKSPQFDGFAQRLGTCNHVETLNHQVTTTIDTAVFYQKLRIVFRLEKNICQLDSVEISGKCVKLTRYPNLTIELHVRTAARGSTICQL